jgi:spermidine synthase
VSATDPREEPATIARAEGRAGGDLVLRRVGTAFEIISNGVFLMDTRNGESERLLIQSALEHLTGDVRMLIGGLGVGFSLAEAIRRRETAVTVVELEPAVIGWHATHLRPFSEGALEDPRVTVECADLASFLRGAARAYDAICLDIDNGPEWTVSEDNAELYGDAGLDLLASRLNPGGVLAVWSANEARSFEQRLRKRFIGVEVRTVPVSRGEPDVLYVAHTPGGSLANATNPPPANL